MTRSNNMMTKLKNYDAAIFSDRSVTPQNFCTLLSTRIQMVTQKFVRGLVTVSTRALPRLLI